MTDRTEVARIEENNTTVYALADGRTEVETVLGSETFDDRWAALAFARTFPAN